METRKGVRRCCDEDFEPLLTVGSGPKGTARLRGLLSWLLRSLLETAPDLVIVGIQKHLDPSGGQVKEYRKTQEEKWVAKPV